MAHVFADRVLESSATTGLGAFALAGAVLGFQAFNAVCAVNDTVPYYIEAVDASGRPTGAWEMGLGTYSGANQLTRTTVRASSNGAAAVNFAAGTKIVGLGVPAPASANARSEWRAALGMTAVGQAVAMAADQAAARAAIGAATVAECFPRGHIDGLTLSTPGASANFTVAPGVASDSTNTRLMTLAAAMTKNMGAWVAGSGNGGKLSAAAIAPTTWYYVFEIVNPTSGVVDIGFDVSPTAPTLPGGFTLFRYIGAMLTNASSQWTKFAQVGDEFYLETPVLELSGAGSTSAVLLTITVPRGRKVKAALNLFGTTSTGIYLSDPANADAVPTSSAAPLGALYTDGAAGQVTGVGGITVWTNTSAQIRYRCVNTNTMRIATLGWIDLRGKNE